MQFFNSSQDLTNKYMGSSHSNTYGNSSFWMDDLVDSHSNSKKFDLFKMVGFQRAISNFVKIVAQKEIPVKFANKDTSYTDGQTVVLSGKVDEKSFDATAGLALHEASHIAHTDMKLTKKVFQGQRSMNTLANIIFDFPEYFKNAPNIKSATPAQIQEMSSQYVFGILNWIEDRRIDDIIFKSSPGYKSYYHALYSKYFLADVITKGLKSSEFRTEDFESYEFRIVGLSNPNTDPYALTGLPRIIKTIDLQNIGRLKSTSDAIELTMQVVDIIFERVVLNKPKKVVPPVGSSNNGTNPEPKEEKKNTPPSNKSSNKEDKADKEQAEDEDITSDNDDEDLVDDESPASSGNSESEDTSDEPTDTSSDESNDDSGTVSPSDEEPTDTKSDSSAELDSDGVPSNEPPVDEDGNLTTTTKGDGQLSPKELGKLNATIADIEELIDGKVDKSELKKGEGKTINSVDHTTSLDTIKFDGDNIPVYGIRVTPAMLLRKDLGLIKDCVRWQDHDDFLNGKAAEGKMAKVITDGLTLGKRLGTKLKVRDQVRDTKYTRLKSGRIDNRMLHQAGFGVMGIFSQIKIDKYTPTVIDISLDISGSMEGHKWLQTQTAVLAIAKACSMIQNIQVKVSYRGNPSIRSVGSIAIFLDVYDSKRDSINHLVNCTRVFTAHGSTPDSVITAYQLKNKLITPGSSEVNSYFINFSDGGPGCHASGMSYGGDEAIDHITKCRKEIEALGVKVMSFYMTLDGQENHYAKADFIKSWGKHNAQFITVTDLRSLASSFNNMFLSK